MGISLCCRSSSCCTSCVGLGFGSWFYFFLCSSWLYFLALVPTELTEYTEAYGLKLWNPQSV